MGVSSPQKGYIIRCRSLDKTLFWLFQILFHNLTLGKEPIPSSGTSPYRRGAYRRKRTDGKMREIPYATTLGYKRWARRESGDKGTGDRCGWVVYSHHRYEYVRRGGDHGKKPGADTMKVRPVTGEFT
jgi:hypothetical protein